MARDKTPLQTDSFGVADGFDFDAAEEDPVIEKKEVKSQTRKSSKTPAANIPKQEQGKNPYYQYHPKTGARGKALGAPRKDSPRTQISIGVTEEDKQLYILAASADGRKLPDFVNTAIKEYIKAHNLL